MIADRRWLKATAVRTGAAIVAGSCAAAAAILFVEKCLSPTGETSWVAHAGYLVTGALGGLSLQAASALAPAASARDEEDRRDFLHFGELLVFGACLLLAAFLLRSLEQRLDAIAWFAGMAAVTRTLGRAALGAACAGSLFMGSASAALGFLGLLDLLARRIFLR